MITPQQLADAFGRNVSIAQMQAKDLTHEDSLVQPPFRGNCLNWVLGHMLHGRNDILRWLGQPPVDEDRAARYRRESEPVTSDEETVIPLAELLASLDASQTRMAAAMAGLTEADLERDVEFAGRTGRMGPRLFFLYFHDTYHTGQTELLRQLAGAGDKII